MTLLERIVETFRRELDAQEDYVTVIITVLLGAEEEVREAERTIYEDIDSDDLPCKSARIKLENWKGKEGE